MMKSTFAAVALLSQLALTAAVCAQDTPEAKPVVAVVQVGDDYQIVEKDGVEALKKQLEAEHKQAVEAHKQAKAEAKKNKEKFTDPAPKPTKVKVVKAAIEQDKAEELVEKLKAEAGNKKGERKARPAKKEKPAKEKPAKKEKPKKGKGGK